MPGLNPTKEDIDQFVAITQATPEDAQHFLTAGATVEGAIDDYFTAQAAGDQPDQLEEDFPDETPDITMAEEAEDKGKYVPRTLDGRPVETPAEWGSSQKKPEKKAATGGGINTLFNTGLHAENSRRPPSPEDGDEDDDDDEEGPKRGQEFFTGGEKSGLAVQNPDQPGQKGVRGVVSNILKQAADNGANPTGQRPTPGRPSVFGGSGNVLGSEDQPIPSPSQPSSSQGGGRGGPQVAAVSSSLMDNLLAGMVNPRGPPPPAQEEETQTRHLTFWRNGFSIEDGPLLSYDDPQNKALLEAIQSGRAPPAIFNVRYNQPLQLEVAQRTGEDYQPPPKAPMRAFGGGGNRLGSPTPEVVSGTSTPNMPGGYRPILEGGSGSSPTGAAPPPVARASFSVDETKPTTSIQLRLGDGTKMVAKVNLTHTIGDLRSYVAASRPDNRRFVLQTTFPSKELTDENETVESAKLQNAVVVQRYT